MTGLLALTVLLVASTLPMSRRRHAESVLDLFDDPDDALVCCKLCCRVHSLRRGCP